MDRFFFAVVIVEEARTAMVAALTMRGVALITLVAVLTIVEAPMAVEEVEDMGGQAEDTEEETEEVPMVVHQEAEGEINGRVTSIPSKRSTGPMQRPSKKTFISHLQLYKTEALKKLINTGMYFVYTFLIFLS